MRNKYLEILELQPGASKSQVKNAYRQLAKKYHPDISKDPDAKRKFIEIAEAYNFLTSVGPRPHQESRNYEYDSQAKEYSKWRQRARVNAQRKAREAERLQQEYIKKILSGFSHIALVIIAFNLLLTLDVFLPPKDHEQKIIETRGVFEPRKRSSARFRYQEIVFEDFTMRFNKKEMKLTNFYDKAVVRASNILSVPLSVVITVDGVETEYYQAYSVLKVFGYIIPVMFLITTLYWYAMQTLDSKLTLAIFMVFLFAMQLYFFGKF